MRTGMGHTAVSAKTLFEKTRISHINFGQNSVSSQTLVIAPNDTSLSSQKHVIALNDTSVSSQKLVIAPNDTFVSSQKPQPETSYCII